MRQRSYNRYSRNGLSQREVPELEVQVNCVFQRLRMERRDWDGSRREHRSRSRAVPVTMFEE